MARLLVASLVLLGLYVAATAFQVVRASQRDTPGRADAVVVLGAAQFDGRPSAVLAQRLDHAAALYFGGQASKIVVTGGNLPGDRVTEGLAGFVYLREQGVPEADLLVEVDGHNTYQELAAAKVILSDRGLSSAILVSDPYHNLRLTQIASEVGLHAAVSPTDAGMSVRDVARETTAVSLGRVVGYRRLAAWR